MFVQCLQTCLSNVWKHVYPIFEDIRSKHLRTCLPKVWKHMYLMCIRCLKTYSLNVWRQVYLMFEYFFAQCLSISAISQRLLARFGSNFKQRVLGTYKTDYNCHHDICKWTICLKLDQNRASDSWDIADMDNPQDKCCQNKCRGDSCNLLYMFPGPFV